MVTAIGLQGQDGDKMYMVTMVTVSGLQQVRGQGDKNSKHGK